MADPDSSRARLVGINHVVLEVNDLEDAVEFYGDLFEFEFRSRSASKAFLDAGDQFLALTETDAEHRDESRHVGVVVDDPERVERRLDAHGVERVGSGIDFVDPWGNRVQIVGYEAIQFTKADHVLEGMGLRNLEKSQSALDELDEKGMAPGRRPPHD